jgi:UDP-N-acetylglucosamine--N-acetylmuramyl-(pentapeptide) pyrophosphoryl-undecaprenol N-acetylglucosamine transferase
LESRPLRLVIAGGGTGGHVLPAIAVVDELRRRNLDLDILWIGSRHGVEREQADRAGIPFRAIQTGKLRRYFALQTITDAARLPIGTMQAWRILRSYRPNVVFSTGGFVSVPTVAAAARIAPILTHEQTAVVGLANRINAQFADVFAVSHHETQEAANGLHRRVVLTGNPVRASMAGGNSAAGRTHLGFTDHLPILFVTGGVRGSSPLNERIAALLPDLLNSCQIVHQTGPSSAHDDAAKLEEAQKTWPEELRHRYRVVDVIGEEMADIMAAATLVVSRSGAGTVTEIASYGPPAILIPLPGAGGDEQTRNARVLSDIDAAVLVPQSEATPERLGQEIQALLANGDMRARMTAAARTRSHHDAASRVADELLRLAGG